MVSKCTEIDLGWLLVKWDKDRSGIDCLEPTNWITFTDGLILGWNIYSAFHGHMGFSDGQYFLVLIIHQKVIAVFIMKFQFPHSSHPSIIIFPNPHKSPMKGNTCFSFLHHLFDFRLMYLSIENMLPIPQCVCGRNKIDENNPTKIYWMADTSLNKFIRFIESYLFQGFSSVHL